MTKKQNVLLIIALTLLFVLILVTSKIYEYKNHEVTFLNIEAVSTENSVDYKGDFYMQVLTFDQSHYNTPKKTFEQLGIIQDFARATEKEIEELEYPVDTRIVMYVENNQTILKYEGSYAIGTDNETKYSKQCIFDFVLDENVNLTGEI